VDELKHLLAPLVGVAAPHFTLHLHKPKQGAEAEGPSELSRLGALLSTALACSAQLSVALERSLRPGETRGKVWLLRLNAPSHTSFLCDWVIKEGDVVGDVKRGILAEAKAKTGLELAFDEARLRRKSWRSPQTVYLDCFVFGECRDVTPHPNWEMFLQERPGPEPKGDGVDELLLLVRRFRPSSYRLEDMEELVLKDPTCQGLREALSIRSGIPAGQVVFARGRGSFPCDLSALEVTSALNWTHRQGLLEDPPSAILDDGAVVYYRDEEEVAKELTDGERQALEASEDRRLDRVPLDRATLPTPSKARPREKGLRIYVNTEAKG